MEPSAELIDELAREEIRDARTQSFEQKFLAGAELFDYACAIAKAGIRMQNPQFSEEQVRQELHRRLTLQERLEDGQ